MTTRVSQPHYQAAAGVRDRSSHDELAIEINQRQLADIDDDSRDIDRLISGISIRITIIP